MGHIKLASPCSHIWFLRGVPSRMGVLLDIPMQQMERVIYFASYIITKVNEDAKKKALEEIENEFKRKAKSEKKKEIEKDLKEARHRAIEEVNSLKKLRVLSEIEYHLFSLKYGEIFEAGTGAESLRKIFQEIDLKKIAQELEKEMENTSPVNRRKILRRLRLIKMMLKSGV